MPRISTPPSARMIVVRSVRRAARFAGVPFAGGRPRDPRARAGTPPGPPRGFAGSCEPRRSLPRGTPPPRHHRSVSRGLNAAPGGRARPRSPRPGSAAPRGGASSSSSAVAASGSLRGELAGGVSPGVEGVGEGAKPREGGERAPRASRGLLTAPELGSATVRWPSRVPVPLARGRLSRRRGPASEHHGGAALGLDPNS